MEKKLRIIGVDELVRWVHDYWHHRMPLARCLRATASSVWTRRLRSN